MREESHRPFLRVTAVQEIRKMLESAEQCHAMVKVILENDAALGATVIVGVDSDSHEVSIDSIIPQAINEMLASATRLKFMTVVDGISMHFAMSYRKPVVLNNVLAHVMTFPENVIYLQQRKFPRLTIQEPKVVHILLRTELNIALNGILLDISRGGLSAAVEDSARVQYMIGDRFPACEIRVSPKESYVFPVAVRYVLQTRDGKGWRLGLEFSDINNVQTRMIDRLVSAMEQQLRSPQG